MIEIQQVQILSDEGMENGGKKKKDVKKEKFSMKKEEIEKALTSSSSTCEGE